MILFRASRIQKDGLSPLTFAAIGIAGYAIAEGAIVPTSSFFPASVVNDTSFLALTGIPIQLIRGILAVLVTCAIWGDYQRCKRIRLPEPERIGGEPHGRQLAFILAIVLITGWIFTEYIGKHADQNVRNEILNQTRMASAAINLEQVKRLTGTISDLTSPDYLRLREQLMAMENSGAGIRWLYLMFLREQKIVFAVDSVAEGQLGHEDPGAVYQQPPKELFDVFAEGQTLSVGPYTDEYGSFISGFVAIRDPLTRQVMSVLGIDIDAGQWQKTIAQYRLMPIFITLLIALLCIGFFMVRQRLLESSQRISASERGLAEAQQIAHVGSWTYNPRTGEFIPSLEMLHVFGLNPQSNVRSFSEYQKCIAPEDRPKLDAALQRAMTTGEGFELESRVIRSDGAWGHIVSRSQARRGRNGEIVQLVGTSQDITERKRVEEQLAEALDLNQKMIAASSVGIITYKASGPCVLANKAAAAMVNASVSQLLAHELSSDRVMAYLRPFPYGGNNTGNQSGSV